MGFYFAPERRRLRRLVRPQESDLRGRTELINCSTCQHLAVCEHPKRSHQFKCNKYEQLKALTSGDYLDMLDFNKIEEEREQERKAVFDIQQMIDQAIADQNQGIQTDFVLEDGDIPLAENFVDFYTNPKYGWGITPFAKQIESATELLTEYCYNPKCTDVEYAKCMPTDASIDQIKEKVTFLKHGVCPECSQTRFDMWDKYKAKKGSTLVLCSGQRSSKDWQTGLVSAYQDHRFVKLRQPALTYHHAPGTIFYQTFTGINFSQAKIATFQPYKDFIQNSKWFKQYFEMLDHVAHKKGKALYKIGEDSIIWNYHGLATLVSSPDVRALRGIARRGWSITELAYFYTKTKSTVKLDPSGIIEALDNSMLGVASGYQRCLEEGKFDVPPVLTFLPSSPRSIRDPIMQMLKTAEEDPSIIARHYCLTGDTLISTNKGILRLDEIHNSDLTVQTQNVITCGYSGKVKITHSHYTGKKKTLTIKSEEGHTLKCSYNHQILVLRNNEHVWVEAKNLKFHDYICISKKQFARTSKLRISCNQYPLLKTMTPNLSFAIGALIAEGFFTTDVKSGDTTVIYNNNIKWLEKIENSIFIALGVHGKIVKHINKGTIANYKGKDIITNKDIYKLIYFSKDMSHLWKYLGLSNIRTEEKKGSWFKVVPWSILQADEQSQLAFLTAYVEADGYITSIRNQVGIVSRSIKLLEQIKVMLASYNVDTKISGCCLISLTIKDAVRWSDLMRSNLSIKKPLIIENYYSKDGFPVEYIRQFFKSRVLPRKGSNITQCLNDDGKIVLLNNSKGAGCWIRRNIINGKSRRLTRDNIDNGLYIPFFEDLKTVSKIEYNKLMKAINHNYRYTRVYSIEKSGVEKMYDLTIENGKVPAFTANGILVHNSSFQFNPNLKETDPFVVSLKIRNPEKYRTSILAIPSDSSSAFIADKRLFVNCIDSDRENAVTGRSIEVISPVGAKMTSGKIRISNKADRTSPKVISIDASEKHNSYAMAIAHLEEWKDEGLITVFDALYEIIPLKNKACFYPDIYDNIIYPVCEELNVKMSVIDRYPGAIHLVQNLDQDLEIPGITRSVKYQDYSLFKQALYSTSVIIPKMECTPDDAIKLARSDYPYSFEKRPIAHTMMQAITVEDLMGKKVDKGEGFTDDLFYAMVNAHAVCNDPNFQEEFLGEAVTDQIDELVGVKVGYSSGMQSIHSVGGAGNSENDVVIGVVNSFKGI